MSSHRPKRRIIIGVAAVGVGVLLAPVMSACAGSNRPTSENAQSATSSTTAESKQGTLRGTHSPLMGIDMPARSEGVWVVGESTGGKPARKESWAVPMSYDKTIAAMNTIMKPGGGDFDSIPWLKEATVDTPDSRYTDWWWGKDDRPLILVRIQQFDGDSRIAPDTMTSVDFERRD